MAVSPDDLVFLPLGGLGEIGMNAALYGFGPPKRRKWIMVDCGVSFAGEEAPGVDLVLPDIAFIEERRADLLGIFITHAHEDHIGALAELWPRLGAPVYMTRFAADLLATRRLSEPGAPQIKVNVVAQNERVSLDPFDVQYVPVSHSIPESNSLAIRTPHGLVVHTGDWKLDDTPYVGAATNGADFRALGEEGVLAMIGDSTNVMREGISPSESEVAAALTEIIKASPARVAITTFASNVARLRAVAEAAVACGREVVVVGRAMDRVVQVARELGYLDGLPDFRSADAYGYLPRDKVVALLTGSQGEPRAALARIASDEHPDIALSKGDKVVFSSRVIPGNEKGVGQIMNNLADRGVEVITDRHGLVHVSGHPRRGEMEQMYAWLRPQIAIPAHGEPLHLAEHAKFARAQGVGQVVSARNGMMVRLAPGRAEAVDTVPVSRLYKDGNIVTDKADRAVSERRRLAFAGVVTVAVAIDDKGEVAGDPTVDVIGLPAKSRKGDLLVDLVADVVGRTLDGLPRARRRDSDFVENALVRAIRSAVQEVWGKKPTCQVLVVEV